MGRRTVFFIAYLLLLLASHLWTARQADMPPFGVFPKMEGKGQSLYVLWGRAGGANEELQAIAGKLGEDPLKTVWAPLQSQERFSMEDVATAVQSSRADSVVVLGIGYGSLEALLLASELEIAPDSLVLVDPALSTRFELLGDDRLNAALKTFQLAWFWVLENAVPHFGYSRELPFNLETARRVFEADQGAAESLYKSYAGKMQLLYPESGSFVGSGAIDAYLEVRPATAAASYGNLDTLAEKVAVQGASFTVSQLDTASEAEFGDFSGVQLSPWWGGFLLAMSTLASEDFACIGGGLLAATGTVGLVPAILGCLLGIFLGDLGIYFIGRVFGATALELPVLRRLVSAKAMNRSAEWFEDKGVRLVVLTRFFPGSRVPTYFAAGVVKVGWIRFTFALLLASAIWTPLLVLAAYFFGERFLAAFESLGIGGWLGILAVIVCFAIGVRLLAKLSTWKGRRMLYCRWRRLIGWEFWPMWAVYAPVIAQIVWLAVRYRSISLPFSVNPCMPASGLVYESKIQILSHLQSAGVPVARFVAIPLESPVDEKLGQLRDFMARLGLVYPVVLKPDVGQRGQGVVIARCESDAEAFFENQEEATIAQEYVEGSEYGVFYQRFANKESGEVISITDKRTTWVEGDGESNLETLILKDERAVCMAPFFLKEFESELESVLARGERFMLASIGTHSRGAVFLDGCHLMTPELQAAVDGFSRRVAGFHFGRYDLRVPNEDALKRGEGIKVIELNGITSEPTHMYDPQHGPLFGWSSLMRQWRSIFALAKENRLAGHEPVSKREVLKLAVGHFRGLPSRDLV
ncbi:VTT domain-containing protein [Pelagicoccus sp. NFK12]|uniref:VTT domain-containing protein n=1 Tax=Pelagicoccus enzymogenes TaxID=2773457 RepID=A0A927F9C2_9BACT|nr:DedA family protein [Pelagicoccus enzymogenes]MBD5780250.1 VTT domain-containing protein [Pelagicoccus enzymogenes]